MPRSSRPALPDRSADRPADCPPARPPAERLIVASGNPGKLREFGRLFAPLPYALVSQAELGVSPAAETGMSFVENALIKARHASEATGSAALADDSGLEVDALGGAPGILSARFAGAGASDAMNNAKLLAALDGVPAARRGARYRCALVLVRSADDPAPLVAEAIWNGRILTAPRGADGFGYDPLFWVPECEASAAELAAADKNRLSHRARALAALLVQLAVKQ